VLRSILAKTPPWMNFAGKDWRAAVLDALLWGLAASALYVAVFYAAMWVL